MYRGLLLVTVLLGGVFVDLMIIVACLRMVIGEGLLSIMWHALCEVDSNDGTSKGHVDG